MPPAATGPDAPSGPSDPVAARRARIARLVAVGQRLGYGLFAAAVVLFVAGAVAGFTAALTAAIAACLVVGSLVLAPAIVLGYGVKAAEREDREAGESPPRKGRR